MSQVGHTNIHYKARLPLPDILYPYPIYFYVWYKYMFRTNIYTRVCLSVRPFGRPTLFLETVCRKRRILSTKKNTFKRQPRETYWFRKLVSEKRNSNIAQGKPQITSFLRHRKPHCFLCGTNSSTGENAKKRHCNDTTKARWAEEMRTNVFSLQ